MKVYFDNAATTPIADEVIEAMAQVMKANYGNPSSIHSHGREARTIIEEARKKVATLINAAPSEIFFTSGGTEADNMAIRCAVEDLGVKNIISSKIEHHAVLHTVEEMDAKGKAKAHFVKLTDKGHIDMTDLERLLKENDNVLVSLLHANNELGNMLDINAVGELCEEHNAIFHCDTVQTMGHYKFDMQNCKAHLLTCAAHKLNGPKGIGFLYMCSDVKLKPLITGGSQERNMRGGTVNVYGIVGLAKSLEIAYRDYDKEKASISELKQYMIDQLIANIPGVQFNGDTDPEHSLYTVLNASFPPSPVAEMLLFRLDIDGISASGGSACSSGSDVGSHVLTGIGADPARPSVRFSFGKQNTKADVDFTVTKLKEILAVPA